MGSLGLSVGFLKSCLCTVNSTPFMLSTLCFKLKIIKGVVFEVPLTGLCLICQFKEATFSGCGTFDKEVGFDNVFSL